MMRYRVLILSNSPNLYTGYSVVFARVAETLSGAGAEVFYLGAQTRGAPQRYGSYTLLGIRNSPWGADALEDYLRTLEIDVLISGMDIWMPQMTFLPQAAAARRSLAWICHVTINSSPLSPYIRQKLSPARAVVAPSRYNEAELKRAQLKNQIHYIPHGVDLDIFRPNKSARSELRAALGLGDRFLFISVAKNNSIQKNPVALFKALRASLDLDESLRDRIGLIYVADPREPGGFDLIALRDYMGLRDHVTFPWQRMCGGQLVPTKEADPKGFPYNPTIGFDRATMAALYNMCDVYISSSSGESFGLGTLESMACGLPQVCNEATTGVELVLEPKTGITVPGAYREMGMDLADVMLISVDGLRDAIRAIATQDPSQYSTNAIAFARRYSWTDIAPLWVELVERVASEK
jgi:glycosyltransferase involved in cell wall biosynthesis